MIDASAMPQIPNANLNGPVIMMGERGSYLIREYWASQFLISMNYKNLIIRGEDKCFYSKPV